MADLYEALQRVTLDGQAVEYFLETNELSGTVAVTTADEADVFQCGKCKQQFTSFQLFILHKKEHGQGAVPKLHNSNIHLSIDESRGKINSAINESFVSEAPYQLRADALATESSQEMGNSVIFSENDILSFAVDANSLHLSTVTQEPPVFSTGMQPEELLTPPAEDPASHDNNLSKEENIGDDYNVVRLDNQHPVFCSPQLSGSSATIPLPSIHSLTKLSARKKIETNVNTNDAEIIHFTASAEDSESPHILLPDIGYSVKRGKNRNEEIVHYGEIPIDNATTVLLDYSNGQTMKACNSLLPNVEFSAVQSFPEEYVDCSTKTDNLQDHPNVVIEYTDSCLQSTIPVAQHENYVKDVESRQPHTQKQKVKRNKPLDHSANGKQTSETLSKNKKTLQPHLNEETSKLMLKCNFCTKLFTKNFDLQQHIRSHTGEKPFQCVVCGRAFSQKSNVKKHMKSHKVWPKDQTTLPGRVSQLPGKENNAGTSKSNKDNTPLVEKFDDCLALQRFYACQFCDMSFPLYVELKSHMKKHSDQKVYKCIQKQCFQTFSDLESFLEHTSNVHITGLQYRCHVCNKKFDNLEALGVHQYSHGTNARPSNKTVKSGLTCFKCKRKFTSRAALEQHMETSSHSLLCSYCGKVFTGERYLRRHLITHVTEKSYTCSVCGKCFRTEQYLKTHLLIHNETRSFVCQHCNAAFSRKDQLVRHFLSHQAIKNFKCPFQSSLGCTREFSRQDKLKRHILTHNTEKQLPCKRCGKLFLDPSQLREHERLHFHKDTKQKCSDCGIVFRSKLLLTSHTCSAVHLEDLVDSVDGLDEKHKTGRKRQKMLLLGRRRQKKCSKRESNKINIASKVRDLHNHRGDSSKASNNKREENISTIEIIVVPFTESASESTGNHSDDRNVYMTYPSASKETSVPDFPNCRLFYQIQKWK